MELIFNELSILPHAQSREIARKRAKLFVDTLITACKHGVSRQLRTQEAFKDSLLAVGYSWWTWMKDPAVDRETRLYLKALVTRAPYLDGFQDAQEMSMACEVYCANKKAEGLGAAYMINGLPVSLNSNHQWDNHCLSAIIHTLDDDGELVTSYLDLHHASRPDHIQYHLLWIQESIKSSVSSGQDLWELRHTCFSSLVFCDEIEEQMSCLPKYVLPAIVRGLLCLENYCQSWASNRFDLSKLGCQASVDAEGAKQQYSAERIFSYQGNKIPFSYHVKLANPWRIYFDPTPGPGKMYVGYVGRHLRTKHDH